MWNKTSEWNHERFAKLQIVGNARKRKQIITDTEINDDKSMLINYHKINLPLKLPYNRK